MRGRTFRPSVASSVAGDVVECLVRHGVVHETLARRLSTIEASARSASRGTASAKPTVSGSRSVPPQPGTIPSITSGKPELRFAAVVGNALAAGERELESAAQAGAGDQRDRGNLERGQIVEDLLAQQHELPGFVGRADLLKLGDVGPGDEVARFAALEDDAANRRVATDVGRSAPTVRSASLATAH